MADPYYGAAPRQESAVVRTNDEFEAMRRAKAKQITERAEKARDRARADNPYWQMIENRRNAPSTAELMYYTGANTDQAQRILETYKDWDKYTPEGGWGQKDIQDIQAEMNSGNWQAPEFQWQWSQPETGGQILPGYSEVGPGDPRHFRWTMTSGAGESPLTIGRGHNKQRFYEDARGMGVSQEALDEFARTVSGQDGMTFNALNWDWSVDQSQKAFDGPAGLSGSKYLGYGNTYRGNPSLWGGDYILAGNNNQPATVHRADGTTSSVHDLPGSMWKAQQDLSRINDQFRQDLSPIKAMNQDFAANMAQRDEGRIRNEQGYDALTGYGNGGLLDENYSNPFFGQITGREAQQSPFTTQQQGQYPWSLPTQQLDLASLMQPGYGGPNGSGTMGAYGGSGWGQGFGGGQNKFGGMGGLGGFQAGPFGAKNPWSPS